jgi:hypothetical protein
MAKFPFSRLFLLCFFYIELPDCFSSVFMSKRKVGFVGVGVWVVQGQHQCAVPPHYKVGNFWEFPIRVYPSGSSGFDYS